MLDLQKSIENKQKEIDKLNRDIEELRKDLFNRKYIRNRAKLSGYDQAIKEVSEKIDNIDCDKIKNAKIKRPYYLFKEELKQLGGMKERPEEKCGE